MKKVLRDGCKTMWGNRARIATPEELPRLLRRRFWEKYAELRPLTADPEDRAMAVGELSEVVDGLMYHHCDRRWHHQLLADAIEQQQVTIELVARKKNALATMLGGYEIGVVVEV